MPLNRNQIRADQPDIQKKLSSDPSLAADEVATYAKEINGVDELFYKIGSNAPVQITEGGVVKKDIPVASVNGQTGTVTLSSDDVPEGTTNSYYPDADASKLAGIPSNAEANPDQVNGTEITNGTSTAIRSYSPADIVNFISTHGGGGGGGAVDSVNGQTGTVVLDADDISDSATSNKFTTQAEIDKLAGIESNAEVNPPIATQSEAETGTNDTDMMTPLKTAQAISAQAGSAFSVKAEEYVLLLPDTGGSLNSRIAGATVDGVAIGSTGWSLETADQSAETIFGSDVDTLIVTWGTTNISVSIAHFLCWQKQDDGPTSTQGWKPIDVTTASDQKTKLDGTKAAVYLSGKGLSQNRDLKILLRLTP